MDLFIFEGQQKLWSLNTLCVRWKMFSGDFGHISLIRSSVCPHHRGPSFLFGDFLLWISVTLLESFQWLCSCQPLCYCFIGFLRLSLWSSHFSDLWLSPRGALTCSLYMISQAASGMQLPEGCLGWGNRSDAKRGWTPGPSVSPVSESTYSVLMVLSSSIIRLLWLVCALRCTSSQSVNLYWV